MEPQANALTRGRAGLVPGPAGREALTVAVRTLVARRAAGRVGTSADAWATSVETAGGPSPSGAGVETTASEGAACSTSAEAGTETIVAATAAVAASSIRTR